MGIEILEMDVSKREKSRGAGQSARNINHAYIIRAYGENKALLVDDAQSPPQSHGTVLIGPRCEASRPFAEGSRPMKASLIALGLCLIAADANAISRVDPTRMSCDRVQETVAANGAVLLRYRSPRNPNLTLYDRYVASDRFCEMGEIRAHAYVPSADLDACPVYKCKRVEFDDPHRFLFPGD